MDSSRTHRPISAAPPQPPDSGWTFAYRKPDICYSFGVRSEMEDGVVRELLRIPSPPNGAERGQSRAVASERSGAPLGECLSPDPFLALLSEGRLPNKQGRS